MRIGIPLSAVAALAIFAGCTTTTPQKPAAAQPKSPPSTKEVTAAKPAKPAEPVKKPEPPKVKEPSMAAMIGQLRRMHRHSAGFSKRGSDRLKNGLTLPKAEAVMCGAFRGFVGKSMMACLTSSKANGPWESVILDLNLNKDLTDDQVLQLPPNQTAKTMSFKYGGKDRTFMVTCSQGRGYVNLTFLPTTALTGTVSFGEGKVHWVMPDCNLNDKLDAGETAYLMTDTKGNILPFGQMKPIRVGAGTRLYQDNNWYSVATNEKGDGFTVKPYVGLFYTLWIDHSDIAKPADAQQTFRITLADRSRIDVTLKNPKTGIKLPMGPVQSLSATIATSPKPLVFSKGRFALVGNTRITLEKPAVIPTVKQAGGKIHVDQKVTKPDGIRYNLARGRKGPLVEIFKGDTKGEPLVKANMKYG